MFTIRHIRKIPKTMLEQIKAFDDNAIEKPNGNTRFYKYYTLYNKELAEVIVAVRNHYKKWYCKQVVVHGIHNDKVYLRDICQTMGYIKVGWFRENISKYPHWYDYDWGWNDDKYFNLTAATVINKDFILTMPEYKYSATNMYENDNILKYLRLYEQYPQTEYLVKANLSFLATSKMILKKCNKDKNFCKWLYKNKNDIKSSYYTSSIISAYKQNRPIEEVFNFDRFKKNFDQKDNFKHLKEVFAIEEQKKFFEYLVKQKTDGYCYQDYLTACEYLGLDMSLDKNRYPHDFKHWHDIRIDEYHSAKALADAKERKALYKKFAKVANKYLSLQRDMKEDYAIVIARSPADLMNEGHKLNHCVGRMGYDQKFAREETLIFFVRNTNDIDTPFVTLEYSLEKHKVLQCYGFNDTKPEEKVLDFVNNKWLPYANKKLKSLVA